MERCHQWRGEGTSQEILWSQKTRTCCSSLRQGKTVLWESDDDKSNNLYGWRLSHSLSTCICVWQSCGEEITSSNLSSLSNHVNLTRARFRNIVTCTGDSGDDDLSFITSHTLTQTHTASRFFVSTNWPVRSFLSLSVPWPQFQTSSVLLQTLQGVIYDFVWLFFRHVLHIDNCCLQGYERKKCLDVYIYHDIYIHIYICIHYIHIYTHIYTYTHTHTHTHSHIQVQQSWFRADIAYHWETSSFAVHGSLWWCALVVLCYSATDSVFSFLQQLQDTARRSEGVKSWSSRIGRGVTVRCEFSAMRTGRTEVLSDHF